MNKYENVEDGEISEQSFHLPSESHLKYGNNNSSSSLPSNSNSNSLLPSSSSVSSSSSWNSDKYEERRREQQLNTIKNENRGQGKSTLFSLSFFLPLFID